MRLIVKGRASLENDMLRIIAGASNPDPRITFWLDDVESPADLYAMAHCFVIPSRSEGWGMPHREAAMMGLPVITCKHSGLDDGHTDEWATVVAKTTTERIPGGHDHILGTWQRADVGEVVDTMRSCYSLPIAAAERGTAAREWLSANQTWDACRRGVRGATGEVRVNGDTDSGPTERYAGGSRHRAMTGPSLATMNSTGSTRGQTATTTVRSTWPGGN